MYIRRIEITSFKDREPNTYYFTMLAERYEPWESGAVNIGQVGRVATSDGVTLSVPDTIRLRDWLTNVIDAAGPRPRHPAIEVVAERMYGMESQGLLLSQRNVDEISDRLYELDERREEERRARDNADAA